MVVVLGSFMVVGSPMAARAGKSPWAANSLVESMDWFRFRVKFMISMPMENASDLDTR